MPRSTVQPEWAHYTAALRAVLDDHYVPAYLTTAPDYVINGDALEIEHWLAETGFGRPSWLDVAAERRHRYLSSGCGRRVSTR